MAAVREVVLYSARSDTPQEWKHAGRPGFPHSFPSPVSLRFPGDGRYAEGKYSAHLRDHPHVDEEQRGEPPGSREFILHLDLRPKSDEPELVYEPSAWKEDTATE